MLFGVCIFYANMRRDYLYNSGLHLGKVILTAVERLYVTRIRIKVCKFFTEANVA